jgi:hypothetical protein
VLESAVRLTEDDLLDFLHDDDWSEAEKLEIVSILVSGATNYRELLTFSAAGCETPQSSPVSETDVVEKDSSSAYDPDSDSDAEPSGSSQASTLAAQGTEEYRVWADAMWESVQEAWLRQFNERLPAITDTAGLKQLIVDDPAALLQAGRWCDNPITLLEHIPNQTIKQWMEPQWVNLCLACVEAITEEVMDATDRPKLDDWLGRPKAEPVLSAKRRALRNSEMWKIMRQQVPTAFQGDGANRLFTYNYLEVNATVLILDELFPDLARKILTVAQWPGDPASARLVTAYGYVQAFREVLESAMKQHSWAPFEDYYNQIGREYAEGPDRS